MTHTKLRSTLDKIRYALTQDKLEALESLIYTLPNNELKSNINNFLYIAIINGSEKCAFFLLDNGATKTLNDNVLIYCKYYKIKDVYNLCEKISNNYNIFFSYNKESLIRRIIEPSKVDDNPERVNYLYTLYESGFIDMKSIKDSIDSNYINVEKKSKLKVILRAITFNRLGI